MTVKEFIEVTFLNQLGRLVNEYPYISFMVMGMGIEFLGKCINDGEFDEGGVSRRRFEEAVNNISAFEKYRHLVGKGTSFDLYDSFRCGLTHFASPKHPITLSSKSEMANLELHDDGKRVNIKCEDFYADFCKAIYEIFELPGAVQSKLGSVFLEIPQAIQSTE